MTQSSGSNLWLFLEMIARRRGLILGLVVLATLIAVVISLILPKWYTASALLLPPPDDSVRGGLSDLTEVNLFTGGVRAPGLVTPNDVYARMLGSRRVFDRIIDQFNLRERYDVTGDTGVRDALGKHVAVRVTDEGLLSIEVEDREPETAAAMATAFVEELIELNRELLSTSTRENREFVEARLNEVQAQLDTARRDLEEFQLEERTVNLDEQTRLAINQAIDLKVSQANLELEISMREQTHGGQHPDLIEKRRELGLIQDQLDQLEWGGRNDSSFFSVPLSAVPGLRGRYESLHARVRVNESLYETLLELYEQARIQEQEDSPTIAVLDWPSVPDLRSRPRRTVIVLGTFVLATLLAIALAGWLEFVQRMKESQRDDYERLIYFANAFFGWLPGVRRSGDRK
jgi:uncharacterized protein involved in exopolysaccharide biosynthesis